MTDIIIWNAGILCLWASLVAQPVKSPPAIQETPVRFLGWEAPLEMPLQDSWASLVTQSVKNLSAVRETWVRYVDWEDPLEKGVATYCSILSWRIPMDRGAW